jgi:signal transduction histidine kinase
MTQHSLAMPFTAAMTQPVQYLPVPFAHDLHTMFESSQVDSLPTVLIVDASLLFRQSIKEVLEGIGFGVLLAARSEEGLRIALQRTPDACIVDFALLDGTRLVQRLRREPALQRMTVLMLSGTDDLEDEGRAFDAGADDYIIKSDGFQVLRHRLKAHLRRRATQEEQLRAQEKQHRREMDLRDAQTVREREEVRQALLAVIERQGTEIHKLHAQIARQGEDAGQRLGDLSGELRRPLNDIIGFSELLGRELFGPLSERQRDYVKKIGGGGRHLLGVVDELLDLTRIEAGRLELARAPTCLGLLVKAVAGIVQPLANDHGVTLTVQVDGNPQVLADRTRLRQALHRLLSHAVSRAAVGACVQVRVLTNESRVEVHLVAVPDASREPGDEQVAHLGLTLARRLLEAHGGGIDLQDHKQVAYLPNHP